MIVLAADLLHPLQRMLLLRQLHRLLPPLPQEQLHQLQRLRQKSYHLHLLRLLLAVLLRIMRVDLIILVPMACAAVSGAIVVPQKHTAEIAAKAIVMHSLLHLHHPVQALLRQRTIRHPLLGSTMMLTTEKIAVSLHTLGTGKLAPPMSKLMLIRTL